LTKFLILFKSVITGEEEVQAEFFAFRLLTFGHVWANLTTTSRVMDKLMFRLDSASRKGGKRALEGALIVAQSYLTTGRK